MENPIKSDLHPRNRDLDALKRLLAFFWRRDFLWLAILLAVCAGWWADHYRRDELSENRLRQAEGVVRLWNSKFANNRIYIIDGDEAAWRWEKDRPLTEPDIDAINGY